MTDEISEYLRHLEDLNRGQNTRDHYAEILRRMDRDMPEGLLYAHSDELRDWIFQPGRSARTRNHYRAIAAGFYGWATDPAGQIIDFNPAIIVPKAKESRRRPRPVSNDRLNLILESAAEPFRRWFLLAACAGLRCIELSGLNRADVTEDELWVRGKGDKDRRIPTHPLVWAEVRDLDGPLVLRRDGRRAGRRYVSARGNEYLHDVLDLPVNMHHLRRWFGTAAYVASGRDIRAVQELLGHAHVNTTEGYIDVATESMEHAVATLPVAVRAA
jgi:integrase/recombinase XerC